MAPKADGILKFGFQEVLLSSLASVKSGKYLAPVEMDEWQWDTVLDCP